MRKFLKIVGIILLVLLAIILISSIIIFIKAKSWENSFESNIESAYLVTSFQESNDLLNEKTEKYILSDKPVDFIEFSPAEISQFLYNALSEMTTDTGITIVGVYSDPGENIWQECASLRSNNRKNLELWICMDVTKDNMQTAQLYVNNITLEGLDIDKIYPDILTKINQGIAEALVTANENAFVGRTLENMELKEDRLIIKGSQY